MFGFRNGARAPFSRCPRPVRSTSDSGKIATAERSDVEGQLRAAVLLPIGSTSFRDSYFYAFDMEFVAHALPPAQESNAARLTW